MADIFLSYEGTDRHRVAPIVALLEASGWSVCWDQDADAGVVRDPGLEGELAGARCVVAAWSADAVASDTVWADASHGFARGILISVSVDFSRPPPELEGAPAIAFAGWSGDASSPRAQELITAIGAAIGAASRAAVEAPVSAPTAGPAEQPSTGRRIAVSSDAPAFIQRAAVEDPLEAATEALIEVPLEAALEAVEIDSDLRVEEPPAAPSWAADADDQAEVGLPPVLVRGPVPRPLSSEARPPLRARFGGGIFAVALCAGLAIIAAVAMLRVPSGPGAPEPPAEAVAVAPVPEPTRNPAVVPARAAPTVAPTPPPSEVKPTTMAPAKRPAAEPTPAAHPKPMEVEELLADMTPRVEELLAGARRLIRIGDIRGARQMLTAPETASSGLLTFLLAETYDPNVLPATLKHGMADPERAKALYRRAGELGDDRAQGRLNALKS